MKILIVGTGAVGGYFGAKLARAGHEVVFTARGDNLSALVERGLAVESFEGDFVLARVRAVESASGEGPFSLGIGLSHQIVIEGTLGQSFAKPYRAT